MATNAGIETTQLIQCPKHLAALKFFQADLNSIFLIRKKFCKSFEFLLPPHFKFFFWRVDSGPPEFNGFSVKPGSFCYYGSFGGSLRCCINGGLRSWVLNMLNMWFWLPWSPVEELERWQSGARSFRQCSIWVHDTWAYLTGSTCDVARTQEILRWRQWLIALPEWL